MATGAGAPWGDRIGEAAAGKPRVAVIGAGMSGLLAGIELERARIDTFTIFEKADRIGGTWRDNTYPGLSCDVPSHLYSYSFEPNARWSHRYSPGPEIQSYFEGVAKKYALGRHLRLGTEIVSARWLEGEWELRTKEGEEARFDIVICATGVLHHPRYPDIPGLDSFEGALFHSARWDHGVKIRDQRVGVIGTGSTATQIVGEIAEQVGKLSLFQRTAQWIFPLPDKEYSERAKRRLARFPILLRLWYRWYAWVFNVTFARAVIGGRYQKALLDWFCRRNLATVRDPDLCRKLTPDYVPACKRLIFSTEFYPAVQRDNVELVTEGIERVEPRGVVTRDGRLHELDVLVLATGFQAHNFMRPMQAVGQEGITLDQLWKDGEYAYRSVALPGYPNFFMLIGPHSPVGNFSLISVAEAQMAYILKCIRTLTERRLSGIVPRRDATERFNAKIREALKNTVWVTGCQSWYLDAQGNPALWPWTPTRFMREMREPDLREFELLS